MKVLLGIFLLVQVLCADNIAEEEGVTIEDGDSYTVSADEFGETYDLLIASITDSDFDDQPTRITNLDEEIEFVMLDYDGQNYLVSVDEDFLLDYYSDEGESQESSSFLEIKLRE
ncbi:unnamed protein product [Blepharisma stoltei]|uniref:Uncharacterized protein n=1 Tax=Blepharisma stoltei TaxID=1481888 RepID=A0AAU9IEU5_9CILI|nr:unnamed protein product [Blepharisma stoltei]